LDENNLKTVPRLRKEIGIQRLFKLMFTDMSKFLEIKDM